MQGWFNSPCFSTLTVVLLFVSFHFIWNENSLGFNSRPHTRLANPITWSTQGLTMWKSKEHLIEALNNTHIQHQPLILKPIMRTPVMYLGETPKCMTVVQSVGFKFNVGVGYTYCWVLRSIVLLVFIWSNPECFTWLDSSIACEADYWSQASPSFPIKFGPSKIIKSDC